MFFLKYHLDVYKSQEFKPETKVNDKKEEEYSLTSLPGICQPPSKTDVTKKENQLKYEAKVDIKKIVLNSKTIMMYRGSKKTSKNKFEPKILAENTDNHVSSIVKDDSVPVNKVVVASPAFVKSTSARKLDSKTCDI